MLGPVDTLFVQAGTPRKDEDVSIDDWSQRWSGGRHSWRHRSDGGFDARRYDVEPIATPEAKEFVIAHHYSRAYVADVQRYGLHEDGQLVGVAVLSMPAGPKVLAGCFPGLELGEALELGRFVLLDDVPANAESWFLARCFRQAAAAGVAGVVSFSDPVERFGADGQLVFPGHWGCIYQATNATYTGRAWPRTMVLLPDGTIFSPRAMTKIRVGERGHEYAERQLVDLGARPLRDGEDRRRWLAGALDAVGARRLRHPGNHRYTFTLGPRRRLVRVGFESAPYPKRDAA